MTTSAVEQETAATATAEQPKATNKASAGARARHVAPAKGKSGKKASPAKKSAQGREESEGPGSPDRQQDTRDSAKGEDGERTYCIKA